MKIQSRLILLFLLISVLIIVISGLTFIIEGQNSLSKRIEAQLESVVVLKENQLHHLIEMSVSGAEEVASMDPVLKYMTEFNSGSGSNAAKEEEILGLLNNKLQHTAFFELFIISMDGKVDISTEPANEGRVWEKENYFIQGKKGTFVQSFYYDIALKEPAITISVPIKSKEGDVVGVLVGRVSTEDISNLMLERSGLGQTGETYLVNKFNFVVSELKKEKGAVLKKTIYTDTVKDCLKGGTGFANYEDYSGEEVVGYYKWIPERDVCLIAKIDQKEAFAPIKRLELIVILIGVGLAVLTIILGIFLAKSISKPITKLKESADKIASGDLTVKTNIKSEDEIGYLATSFDSMVETLQKTRDYLQGENKKLTEELQKLKKKSKK